MRRFKPTITLTIVAAFSWGCQPQADPAGDTASAEPATLIPRSALFGNADRSQGRISPDGSTLSWLAPRDGVQNIWVAPTDSPEDARPITADTGRGIQQHLWASDSTSILYLQDQGGNENEHVYAVDIESAEVRDLTPVGEGKKAVLYGVSRFRPGVVLVGLNERDPQLFDLYEVEIAANERTLVAENPGFADWLIDNELVPRFALQPKPDGGMTVVQPGEDGNWDPFTEIPAEDVITATPVGFDGGNTSFFLIDSRGRDKAALVKINADTSDLSVLAESDQADIADVWVDPESFEPLAYAVNHLRSEWTALTEDAAKDIELLNREINGDYQFLAATDDGSKFVLYADAPDAPGVYYVYNRSAGQVSKMFDTRPDLAGFDLEPMQAVEIPARDGLSLVSYLTLPTGSNADGDGIPDAPVPMVLTVHGGPWARDAYGFSSWDQWLANRGYAVLSVNYRGSTGFGKEFTNAAIGEFAGKMHDDLIDAVQWSIDRGIADPERIAIMGGSYGGYATLIGVTFTPNTFACGVDLVGPSSLATLIESFPDYWGPFLDASWYKFVGNPAVPEEREAMLERSAISRVDSIQVPLLIGQGENDPRVTKLESDQIAASMKEKGLPVTYVNYPDEGHGFVRPENRMSFYAITEGFLTNCLGGRMEEIGSDFENSSLQVLEGAEHVAGLGEKLATAE
jgi:dipeptidyl aminopeptidase/acylaminoacyl peptidase